jgi:hypothetical protein
MKRKKLLTLLSAIGLLLVLGFIAVLNCIRPSNMKPIVTLTIPAEKQIGMDYYHESMDYLWLTNEQVERDLNLISQVTHKIKVYHNPFRQKYTRSDKTTANALEVVKNIVRKAKAHHMYVVWTENDDSIQLTDALWESYSKAVIADAAEARSVGADEFLVGNEIANHNNSDPGFNDVNLPRRIKHLVTDCGTAFPGPRGYQEGWYKSESWYKAKIAPLHKIYLTLYETWHIYKSALDQIVTSFGDRAELGEVSTMAPKSELHQDEQAWTRDLLRRYDYARQKGIPIWLFTFREPGKDSLGLFQGNQTLQAHDIWQYLTKQKTLTYPQLLSHNFQDGTTQAFTGDGYIYHHRLRVNEFKQAIAQIPAADYVFRGLVRPVEASGPEKWRAMRLVFRYRDANNYYFVNIEPNDDRVQLFKRENEKEISPADTPSPVQFGEDYDFEIRVHGSGTHTSIQVFWNTVQLLVIPDSGGSSLLSGAVGMKNNGVTGELSEVLVTGIEA